MQQNNAPKAKGEIAENTVSLSEKEEKAESISWGRKRLKRAVKPVAVAV